MLERYRYIEAECESLVSGFEPGFPRHFVSSVKTRENRFAEFRQTFFPNAAHQLFYYLFFKKNAFTFEKKDM